MLSQVVCYLVFFFKQDTAFEMRISDWSSDVCSSDLSAALEFAVQFLKIEEIVVMGHGMCGGCHAALHRSMVGAEPGRGGFIADWIAVLDEGAETVRAANPDIDNSEAGRALEMAAVRGSIDNLRTFPCIQEKERRGTLKLRGAHFAINEGVLHLMDEAK